jgi:hypothetical protein
MCHDLAALGYVAAVRQRHIRARDADVWMYSQVAHPQMPPGLCGFGLRRAMDTARKTRPSLILISETAAETRLRTLAQHVRDQLINEPCVFLYTNHARERLHYREAAIWAISTPHGTFIIASSPYRSAEVAVAVAEQVGARAMYVSVMRRRAASLLAVFIRFLIGMRVDAHHEIQWLLRQTGRRRVPVTIKLCDVGTSSFRETHPRRGHSPPG